MSFFVRKHFGSGLLFIPSRIERKTLEDGRVIFEHVSSHSESDVENFRLSSLIKAGVPLEQVNTQIISSSSFDLPFDFESSVNVDDSETEPKTEPKTESNIVEE